MEVLGINPQSYLLFSDNEHNIAIRSDVFGRVWFLAFCCVHLPGKVVVLRRPIATRATTRATTIEGEVEYAADPRKGSSSNNNEGRVMLQKALELLGEYRPEFQGLREAVNEQNGIINNQQEAIRDLKEAAEEQQNMTRELSQQLEDTKKQMGDELKRVRDQLEAIAACAAATPQFSFDDVTRSPPSSQPSNVRTLSSGHMTPSNLTDALYCTIDTSRVEEGEGDPITSGAIRTIAESEVRAEQGQSGWRCQAVTKDGKNPNRIKIVCRDEAEHQMVKRLVGAKLARGARVLRDELYLCRRSLGRWRRRQGRKSVRRCTSRFPTSLLCSAMPMSIECKRRD